MASLPSGRTEMMDFTVGQAETGRLAKDQHRIGPVAPHQPVGDVDPAPWRAPRAQPRLFKFAVAGEWHEPASFMRPADAGLSHQRCAARCRAGRYVGDFFGTLPGLADFRLLFRASPTRAARSCTDCSCCVSSSRNKLPAEFGAATRPSRRECRRSRPALRGGRARFGNPGAAVVGDRAGDFAIAAAAPARPLPLRQAPAARRMRHEMSLTFSVCEIDEIGFQKPRAPVEHRAGQRKYRRRWQARGAR